jgi:hypothetical protein
VSLFEEDVARLDVAVNQSMAVCVVEGFSYVPCDANGLVHGKLLLSVQSVPQAFTFDVWHDVVEQAVCLAGVVERYDMRMSETGNCFDLTEEAVRTDSGSQLGVQDLDCDLAVVPQVLGQEDRSHPTATDLRLDSVAVRESRPETFQQVRHKSLLRNEGGAINIGDSVLERLSDRLPDSPMLAGQQA